MKKKLLLVFFIILGVLFTTNAQNVGVGTNNPDASAKLDVKATDKGFLPPRVDLTATNNASPVTSPATGLIVYNKATAGSFPNNVKPGYYYWDGSKWVRLIDDIIHEVDNTQDLLNAPVLYSCTNVINWTINVSNAIPDHNTLNQTMRV